MKSRMVAIAYNGWVYEKVFYLEISKFIHTFVKTFLYTLLYTVKIYLYGNKFQNT